MARTIRISDRVYKPLKPLKLPTKSLSTVTTRDLRKGKISEIAGRRTLTKSDWKKAKKYLSAAEGTTLSEVAKTR